MMKHFSVLFLLTLFYFYTSQAQSTSSQVEDIGQILTEVLLHDPSDQKSIEALSRINILVNKGATKKSGATVSTETYDTQRTIV